MAGNDLKKVDAVFEGGGVKGIALIGAAEIVEAAGYAFHNLAGTSAGAIIAALLAAGYSAAELKPILMGLDFKQFEDTSLLGRIPLLGKEYEVVRYLGIYDGDYFLNLMRRLLSEKLQKDEVTFRDLILPGSTEDRYRFKVHVIASDISRGRMLVLPDDIRAYGREPEDLEVATAVRMSMSIPFFFKPVTEKNRQGEACYIVDGGLLSNFPIELFDTPPPADP
ncbi:MAG: patatin-like phospholipase family protein, partial [Planctomycetaceae bacterium]|nr:patatin-like phospholipase family protein [Planctomycetaceae bacterium]